MALTTGFFSSSRLILVGVHRVLTCGCAGSSLIPRAEVSLRRAGQGTGIILKDEWWLNRRSHPHPYPRIFASLLCPRLHLHIYAKKPPAPPPSGVGKPGAISAIRYCRSSRAVMPWALRSGGTPVRVRAVRCRARARCRGLRTGVRHLRVRRAGSAAWRLRRA